jgi:hypothetical protein
VRVRLVCSVWAAPGQPASALLTWVGAGVSGGCCAAAHVDRHRVQGGKPATQGACWWSTSTAQYPEGYKLWQQVVVGSNQTDCSKGAWTLCTPPVSVVQRDVWWAVHHTCAHRWLYVQPNTSMPVQAVAAGRGVCECADATACGECLGGQDRIVGLQGLISMSTPSRCCCQQWMVHWRCVWPAIAVRLQVQHDECITAQTSSSCLPWHGSSCHPAETASIHTAHE